MSEIMVLCRLLGAPTPGKRSWGVRAVLPSGLSLKKERLGLYSHPLPHIGEVGHEVEPRTGWEGGVPHYHGIDSHAGTAILPLSCLPFILSLEQAVCRTWVCDSLKGTEKAESTLKGFFSPTFFMGTVLGEAGRLSMNGFVIW